MKLLTIITVNYNNGEGLKRTAKSIEPLLSTHTSQVEWYVMDGGSTDESLPWIENHTQYITYWQSQRDKGTYDAMNQAVALCHGQYLLFLNSGDELDEDFTLEQIDFTTGEDLIYGDALLVDKKGATRLQTHPNTLTLPYFLQNGSICHQSVFFRRSLLVKEPYDYQNYSLCADLFLILHSIFERRCSYRHVDVTVCVYETFGLSASRAEVVRSQRRKAIASLFRDGTEEWYDALYFNYNMNNPELFGLYQYVSLRPRLQRAVYCFLRLVVRLHKIFA